MLKSVVDDVGADRGVLVSEAGFQAGAIRAAEHTNITLTSLEELKQTAGDDLLFSVLHNLETKAIELQHALHRLYVTEGSLPGLITSKPRPGVNGHAVMEAQGKLGTLRFGFEYARLRQPPYMVGFNDSGEHALSVTTLEEFAQWASKIIEDARATLLKGQESMIL